MSTRVETTQRVEVGQVWRCKDGSGQHRVCGWAEVERRLDWCWTVGEDGNGYMLVDRATLRPINANWTLVDAPESDASLRARAEQSRGDFSARSVSPRAEEPTTLELLVNERWVGLLAAFRVGANTTVSATAPDARVAVVRESDGYRDTLPARWFLDGTLRKEVGCTHGPKPTAPCSRCGHHSTPRAGARTPTYGRAISSDRPHERVRVLRADSGHQTSLPARWFLDGVLRHSGTMPALARATASARPIDPRRATEARILADCMGSDADYVRRQNRAIAHAAVANPPEWARTTVLRHLARTPATDSRYTRHVAARLEAANATARPLPLSAAALAEVTAEEVGR